MRSKCVHEKAFALVLLLFAQSAFAATAFNALITNTATAQYDVGATPVTVSDSVITQVSGRTPSTIKFFQYIPPTNGPVPGEMTVYVPTAQCSTSGAPAGPYAPSPAPVPIGGSAITVPSSIRLVDATNYVAGEPVFVQVTDLDQNTDPLSVQTIIVRIHAPTGDTQWLRLTETGLSTGVFAGYIQTTTNAVSSTDCMLSVGDNQKIDANYVDVVDNSDSSADAALIDPYGLVFDSVTGNPVNGINITLMDGGSPAVVYCDDGVTPYPSTVQTGSSFSACGGTITLPPGTYRFPYINFGSAYTLAVDVNGQPYSAPSTVGDATLQTLPGNPFALATGSRGETFAVNPGPALRIDIPIDPQSGNLQITKSAGKPVAGIGDFVPYTLSIRNNGATALAGVQIADHLPQGFRYQSGSTKLDGTFLADPAISADGRTLTFNIANIAANAMVTLRYVAQVSAGSKLGNAENTAAATGAYTSNTARASVLVHEELLKNRAILIGRVIIGSCDSKVENDEKGLPNARVILQDGRYVQTDLEGRWHMDNIRPGTHVVQLDLDSLPDGYEAVACEKNTRFAGRSYSQFVNVRGGTLWRADFHVQKKAPEAICLNQKLSNNKGIIALSQTYPVPTLGGSLTFMLPRDAHVKDVTLSGKPLETEQNGEMLIARLPARSANTTDTLQFSIDNVSGDIKAMARIQPNGLPSQSMPVLSLPEGTSDIARCVPVTTIERTPEAPMGSPAQQQLQLVERLPYDDVWLTTAKPGVEWLHPRESFFPALPSIKIAVKHEPKQRIEMLLNGEPVSPLNFDGTQSSPGRTVLLSTWRGVDIRHGANTLEMHVIDETGKVIHTEKRTIRYISQPTQASLNETQSRLVADGKTRPVIAVKFTDDDGYPVRKGLNGEFQINEPYQAWDKLEGLERQPLNGRIGGKPRYEITADGTALIELEPTTQSGEVVLTFRFNGKKPQEIRAWLKPAQRDWILVGFAEGTLGNKQLSGNMESLKGADADEQLFDKNRVAFYAKGTIKGKYLLTMAYDTAKSRGEAGSLLKAAVDPNQYYTLYADATQPQFDAASARKLYLKIERNQFYAMFGDYDTGMTVTEFSRYSRTLNGLKSEFKGDKLSYNAFATLTAQAYVKDEILGDGTSGLYKLSRSNIVINSDKVRIETRDRFHSEVIITSQYLTRYLDYDIDTDKGTLFFREPVQSKDGSFNPTYIVAEYESQSHADEKATFGGRVAYKPANNLEVGLTHIHEGNVGASGSLTGGDLTLKLDDSTVLKAELAKSDRTISGSKSDGTAWKIEAVRESRDSAARVYLREQQEGFGLGQQAGGETGTRKVGADAKLRLSDTLALQGEIYRQDTLATDATRNQAEGQVQWHKDALTAHAGLRLVQDTDGVGKQMDSRQLTTGVAYQMFDKKLTLKAESEIDLSGQAESVDFPNRLVVGADYKLTQQTSFFAEQEFARGDKLSADTTRIGLRTLPWSGGELAASLGNQYSLDSGRLFAEMGLIQKWQINEFWQADVGVDRTQTLKSSGVTPLNTNVPLASGTLAGDYTALFAGAAYNDKTWSANGRIEWRTADTDDKINLLMGLQRNLDAGRSMAVGLTFNRAETATGTLSRKFDGRLSYAHRPWDSQWIWLDRLDYIDEIIEDTNGGSHARKLINNLNANWRPDIRTQIAFQYGAKYVLDRINGSDYDGYTDLVSLEMRHDLTEDWDLGLHAGALHSWNGGQVDYNLGASVGYKAFDNTWVSVGYNVLGFTDKDFAGAEYRSKGPYANIRMKIDQDTLGLNNPNGPSLLKH